MRPAWLLAFAIGCTPAPALAPAPSPPVTVAPSPPPTPPPEPTLFTAGAACTAGAQCASGVCEGEGCNVDGVCAPTGRMCTRDLVTYCSCDGSTFQSSGSCPGRRFDHRGGCDAPPEE